MKELIIQIIKKDPLFFSFLILTFVLAIFLRTFDYSDRVYIHADHSLFAQAAIYSAENFTLPQIGPFSQSSFFTGPWWLWILGIFYLFPFGFLTPWYFISIISIGCVLLMYIVGREIGGKWLGAIAAALSAFSIVSVDNSLSLWNAAADSILALVAIYFFIKFFKTKKWPSMFGLSFFVSLAFTIHFQAGLLLPLIIVALVTSRPKLKFFAAAFFGFAVPLLPFLFFDLRFNWWWVKSVWIYVTVDQYRFWVPNRWLTYAFDYWPTTWGYILGSSKLLGFLAIGLLSVLTVVKLRKIREHKIFYLLALSFFLEVVMFRYYGGQRFVYFSNFAQPFVFILTAWTIIELYKLQKYFGIILGGLLILLVLKSSFFGLGPRDFTVFQIVSLKNEIYASAPNSNFNIYGCGPSGALVSHPLALMMYADGRDDILGKKVGMCVGRDRDISWQEIEDSETLREDHFWLNHSTFEVYTSMTEWFLKNPPK